MFAFANKVQTSDSNTKVAATGGGVVVGVSTEKEVEGVTERDGGHDAAEVKAEVKTKAENRKPFQRLQFLVRDSTTTDFEYDLEADSGINEHHSLI